ncbi:MAG: phage tail assembly chaperone [bacterium]
MRLPAEQFWSLTLAEWLALLSMMPSNDSSFHHEQLNKLKTQFPD